MTANLVQVDYQQLDAIIRQFDRESQELRMVQAQVKAEVMDLYGRGWLGEGANQFHNEMERQLLPSLMRAAEAMQVAGQTLKMMMQVYQQAETEAAQLFKQEHLLLDAKDLPPEVRSIILQLASLAPGLAGAKQALELIIKASKNRTLTREVFQTIGRLMNALGDTRGNVKLMEGLYHKIFVELLPHNSPFEKFLTGDGLDRGLAVAGGIIGTFEDINKGTYGDNWGKAIGVNGVKALTEFLVSKNPVGLAVSLANGAKQLEGMVQIGVMKTVNDLFVGDPVLHNTIMNNLNLADSARQRADLSNIYRPLAEGVVDTAVTAFQGQAQVQNAIANGLTQVIQHPSLNTLSQAGLDIVWTTAKYNLNTGAALLNGVFQTGKEVVKVADGLVDWQVAQSAANSQMEQYVISRLLPPDASSAMVHNMRETAVQQTEWASKIVNFIDIK